MSLYSVLGSPRLSYFENRWSSKAHTFELLGKTTATRWRACAANGGGEGAPRQRGASARETPGAAARVRRARAGAAGAARGCSRAAAAPRNRAARENAIRGSGQAARRWAAAVEGNSSCSKEQGARGNARRERTRAGATNAARRARGGGGRRGRAAATLARWRGEGSHCTLRQSQRERRGRGHARRDASASAAAPGRLDDLTFCIGPPPLREAGGKSRGRGGRPTHLRGETPSARARGSWGPPQARRRRGGASPRAGNRPTRRHDGGRAVAASGECAREGGGRRAAPRPPARPWRWALGAGRWARRPQCGNAVLGCSGKVARQRRMPLPARVGRHQGGTKAPCAKGSRERGRRDDARRRGRAAAATGKPRRRNCTWEEACARECGERRAAPRDATDARRRRWAPSPRMGQRRV